MCRNFAKFRNCQYVRWDYTHSQDNGDINNIHELQKEVDDLKKKVQFLSQSHPRENEPKIKILEDEVEALKLEIKNLVNMYNKVSETNQDNMSKKPPEGVNDNSSKPAKIKFKCDKCDSSFKKNITLEKHKNTKHSKNNSTSNRKIGEGQNGFAFDVRPGKESEAEELRLEWKEKKKEDNSSNEKEQNMIKDKV